MSYVRQYTSDLISDELSLPFHNKGFTGIRESKAVEVLEEINVEH